MKAEPVTLLKAVARKHGKRVKRLKLFDGNVCVSPVRSDRPWEYIPIPGDFFEHEVALDFLAHKIKIRANREFVVIEVRAESDIKVFSINRRDTIFQLQESPARIPGLPSHQIYSNAEETRLLQLLVIPNLGETVAQLLSKETDSLHFYRNGPVLYFEPSSSDELESAAAKLCALADSITRARAH